MCKEMCPLAQHGCLFFWEFQKKFRWLRAPWKNGNVLVRLIFLSAEEGGNNGQYLHGSTVLDRTPTSIHHPVELLLTHWGA